MIDLARRVIVAMTRASWERPSPHTGGWRL